MPEYRQNVMNGDERGLCEMPHLYGAFTCEYRHAHRSLPFLQACKGEILLNSLRSWHELGYPAFSGCAEYAADLEIPEAGKYRLDLGQVEDTAEVFIDGEIIELLAWPPYTCSLNMLKAGKYTLTVKVSNGPGNHDRLAMLKAGLLGTVLLKKQET